MDLNKDRLKHRTANQRFRRARRMYVYFMRHEINEQRNVFLDYMVERMKDRGLYSHGTHDRGVRQAYGWDAYSGYSKPVALMEYLIKTYSNPGDTVLDFAMGSGTTGIACSNTSRQFIGIEKTKKYYEIAIKRAKTEEKRK